MRRARIIVLSTLALLLTGGGLGGAEEPGAAPERPVRRGAEILAQVDQPPAEKGWLAHHLDRIHIHRKSGLAYSRPLAIGEQDLELRVLGPAMGRKRVGLSFEIRF